MNPLPDISVALMFVAALLCIALLTESRLSKRATISWEAGVGVLCLGVNQVARLALGTVQSTQALVVTVVVPYLLLFWWLSALRQGRVAFTVCMVLDLMFVPAYLGYVLDHWVLTPGGLPYGVSRLAIRVVASAALVVASVRWRAPYLAVLRSWDRGWWGKSAIAVLLCVLQVLVDTSIDHKAPWPGEYPQVVALWVVVILLFAAMLTALSDQLRLAEASARELDALAAAEALRSRVELSEDSEAALAEGQAAFQARLAELDALLAAGEVDAARELVALSDAALARTRVRRWCANPVYDAVIGAYLRRAEALGAEVDARIELDEGAALDATELSCVFGNALENALHALARVPAGERRLRLRCVCWPQLMVMVGNSCADEVMFAADGLPATAEAGHGLGTRSIAAYCAKHGASLDYQCEAGWFSMTLVQEL